MFMTIYIAVVAVLILVGCVVAIVMSTSHGSSWLQSRWEGTREGGTGDDGGRDR